jgi:hypothetical protein
MDGESISRELDRQLVSCRALGPEEFVVGAVCICWLDAVATQPHYAVPRSLVSSYKIS